MSIWYSDSEYEINCISISIQFLNNLTKSQPPQASSQNDCWTVNKSRSSVSCGCLCYCKVPLWIKLKTLDKFFGPVRVCGSTGHYGMYIALPDNPNCEFTDKRKKLIQKMLILLLTSRWPFLNRLVHIVVKWKLPHGKRSKDSAVPNHCWIILLNFGNGILNNAQLMSIKSKLIRQLWKR